MPLMDRLKNAWNAFRNKDPTNLNYYGYGQSYGYRPDRTKFGHRTERTIVNSIYNRIAMDTAAVSIKHVQLDEHKRYKEEIDSDLNNCLSVEANVDQTGRALIQDTVMSMLDDGSVAIVPTDLDDENPWDKDGGFSVLTMRTGKIREWFPKHVRLDVYNENTGQHEEIVLPKRMVCIIENPMYAVMNEPNSTMQRFIRKLALLDSVDEKSCSGKLDIIIQLPYIIKTEARRQQAEQRRKDIEQQLSEGTYGIAYTDGTEKITQLNRPAENNLMKQIEYLTSMLFSQLGITQEILDGTADEQAMLNYQNRVVEPILSAITDEMKRKWLSKNARTRGQTITFFNDPFKLVPLAQLAGIGDKFTRNAIITSNEMRQKIGMEPSNDPDADALRNKNMPIQDETEKPKPFTEGEESAQSSSGNPRRRNRLSS